MTDARAEHRPLVRWMWVSGLLCGQALTAAGLGVWTAALLFAGLSLALAGFYKLEGSYGRK